MDPREGFRDRIRAHGNRCRVRCTSGRCRGDVLPEKVLGPQQCPRDLLLPAGYRATLPRYVQDWSHSVDRALLLRHLLGLWDGRHGHGGQEPGRSDQIAVPPLARSRGRHRKDRIESAGIGRHCHSRIFPVVAAAIRCRECQNAHQQGRYLRVVSQAVLLLRNDCLRPGAGNDLVCHDLLRGGATSLVVPGSGMSGFVLPVRLCSG
mmetsp:Transcript_10527/g.30800  ORF Transcript_10527/g.30800 Transcript_10527/m.30800 type:complete len:206 (+) Transcript_10527:642-1259(+)